MKTWVALLFVSALASTMTFAQEPKGLRQVVASKDAPQAIGPYSQAVKAGGFVFASGQIALDPATGKLIDGDITAQTERVLKNRLQFSRPPAAVWIASSRRQSS